MNYYFISGHIGDFSEQHLSKEEFKILMGTFKFKLQGATRTSKYFIHQFYLLWATCDTFYLFTHKCGISLTMIVY